jgi:sporulation protein YlmC with PRC-barrel domain
VRLLSHRVVVQGLVSVAALSGSKVTTSSGAEVGRLVDVVARWGSESYPTVTGLVVRVGPRRAFVHAGQVAEVSRTAVRLASARVDLNDMVRRPGEVLLARDVLDHQVVDVNGARVVRASDLYLARVGAAYKLVGVDVGMGTFLRRVAPASWRRRTVPERVIDWADVAPFSAPGAPVRLRAPHEGLRELQPAELADLLEDLGRAERRELLTTLTRETAADVLEEMDPDEVIETLRDAANDEAADLLLRMEPDEAVDALRDLSDDDRAAILAEMPPEAADHLRVLLEYPEREAGGFMTTHLAVSHMFETVTAVRDRLRDAQAHAGDIDAVVVVDEAGKLIDDVPLFDLLVAQPDARVADLVGPPWPATVAADAALDEVVERLVANRSSSLLVVDATDRPLGRIMADDVLDVLTENRGRRWPWQSR